MLLRRLLGDALYGLLLLESCRWWGRFGTLLGGSCGGHFWGGIRVVIWGRVRSLGWFWISGLVSVNFGIVSLFNHISLILCSATTIWSYVSNKISKQQYRSFQKPPSACIVGRCIPSESFRNNTPSS